MLNSDGFMEVVKKYKNGGKASVFIRAKHPTNTDCKELLLKKNADLKRVITSKGIECENQSVNAIMRKSIWEHYADDLNLQDIEIDVSKEDAKKIWDKLSSYMPVYSLFQSDRKNSDGDSEVQDPLKEAVKQIINDEGLQQTLASVAEVVETKLKEVSSSMLNSTRRRRTGNRHLGQRQTGTGHNRTTKGRKCLRARPLDYEWVLAIREQCISHNVRFEFRQCGMHFIKDGKLIL